MLGSSWSNYFGWGVTRGCHDGETATSAGPVWAPGSGMLTLTAPSQALYIIWIILSIIFSCSRCRGSHLSIPDEVYWRDLEQQSRIRWVHLKVAPLLQYTFTVPKLCTYRCTVTLRVHCRLSSWHMEIWIISNFQCCQNSSNILSWQYIWVAISYKVPSIQKKHIHTHGVTHRQLWKFNIYEL